MCGPDLGLGLGFYIRVGRGCNLIGLVNGGRLGLLLGFGLATRTTDTEPVDTFDNAVEFFLKSCVRADVELAAEQSVNSIFEILLGTVGLARLVVGQPRLIFLFDTRNQAADEIRRIRGGRFGGTGLRGTWFLRRAFLESRG